jgi:hypothetical protein
LRLRTSKEKNTYKTRCKLLAITELSLIDLLMQLTCNKEKK